MASAAARCWLSSATVAVSKAMCDVRLVPRSWGWSARTRLLPRTGLVLPCAAGACMETGSGGRGLLIPPSASAGLACRVRLWQMGELWLTVAVLAAVAGSVAVRNRYGSSCMDRQTYRQQSCRTLRMWYKTHAMARPCSAVRGRLSIDRTDRQLSTCEAAALCRRGSAD